MITPQFRETFKKSLAPQDEERKELFQKMVDYIMFTDDRDNPELDTDEKYIESIFNKADELGLEDSELFICWMNALSNAPVEES